MADMTVDRVEVIQVVKVTGWIGGGPEAAGYLTELFYTPAGELLAGVCPGLLHRDIRMLVDVAGPAGELQMRCNPLPLELRSTCAAKAWEQGPLHGDAADLEAA